MTPVIHESAEYSDMSIWKMESDLGFPCDLLARKYRKPRPYYDERALIQTLDRITAIAKIRTGLRTVEST